MTTDPLIARYLRQEPTATEAFDAAAKETERAFPRCVRCVDRYIRETQYKAPCAEPFLCDYCYGKRP